MKYVCDKMNVEQVSHNWIIWRLKYWKLISVLLFWVEFICESLLLVHEFTWKMNCEIFCTNVQSKCLNKFSNLNSKSNSAHDSRKIIFEKLRVDDAKTSFALVMFIEQEKLFTNDFVVHEMFYQGTFVNCGMLWN